MNGPRLQFLTALALRYNYAVMSITTPAKRALESLGIPYRLHLHEESLRSLEQAAEERGLKPHQIVRTLLFRLEAGSYILVLMPGPEKVAWQKLRRWLGVSRLTTASAQELLEVTGYETGVASPFGLPRPIRLLADRGILDHEIISIGAEIRNAGLILKREDLIRALEPEIGGFVRE
jgi:Cys-tRNA(Pro)/Cys-tRNA(Cys) deacylase